MSHVRLETEHHKPADFAHHEPEDPRLPDRLYMPPTLDCPPSHIRTTQTRLHAKPTHQPQHMVLVRHMYVLKGMFHDNVHLLKNRVVMVVFIFMHFEQIPIRFHVCFMTIIDDILFKVVELAFRGDVCRSCTGTKYIITVSCCPSSILFSS